MRAWSKTLRTLLRRADYLRQRIEEKAAQGSPNSYGIEEYDALERVFDRMGEEFFERPPFTRIEGRKQQ